MNELFQKRCTPCEGGVAPIGKAKADELLAELAGWALDADGKGINRTYEFNNFHEVMAFANAAAWVAHQEDHHPELLLSYKQCVVHYMTHAIDGLSENDFICAAKVNALIMAQPY